jgi:hypothetical protein
MTRYEPLTGAEKNFNVGVSGYIGILPSSEANFYDFQQSLDGLVGSYSTLWHSGMITGVPDLTRHQHFISPSIISQSGWFRVGECDCPVSGLSGVTSFLSNIVTEKNFQAVYAWRVIPDASISNAAEYPIQSGISGIFNPYIHYRASPDGAIMKVGFSGIYGVGHRFDIYNAKYRALVQPPLVGSPEPLPLPQNIPNGTVV